MRIPAAIAAVFAVLAITGSCQTDRAVGYRTDVYPLIEKKCLECHMPPCGPGYVQTGLDLRSYDSLMQGTVFGPVIIPGDSRRSVINKLIEGRVGDVMCMPHGQSLQLSAEETETMRLWVEQGAKNN